MLCAISGVVPREPVVSKKSGLVFEKRLVLKIVRETGRDPVTDEETGEDDLLEIKGAGAAAPRPASATSVPALLALFQSEWDAAALELHSLRTALHAARKELAAALFQQDAATRVIARLLRERDEARTAAEEAARVVGVVRGAAGAGAAGAEGDEAPSASKRPRGDAGGEGEADAAAPAAASPAPLEPEAAEALSSTSAVLSKQRRKRATPPGTASAEEMAGLAAEAPLPVHRTRTGVLCVAVARGALGAAPTSGGAEGVDAAAEAETSIEAALSPSDAVATGGADGKVVVSDPSQGRVLAEADHGKRVTSVAWLGDGLGALASGGVDATVKVWGSEAALGSSPSYALTHSLPSAGGAVVGLGAHPSGRYLFAAGAEGAWSLLDVVRGAEVTRVLEAPEGESAAAAYASAALHPDGLIFGAGTAGGAVALWEARARKKAATLGAGGAEVPGHASAVRSLSFSENGYHLASLSAEEVKIWDLRKLQAIAAIPAEGDGGAKTALASVSFDHSGLFLAVGGAAGIHVHGTRKHEWGRLAALADAPKRGVTALAWGSGARSLYAASPDHNLRTWHVVG